MIGLVIMGHKSHERGGFILSKFYLTLLNMLFNNKTRLNIKLKIVLDSVHKTTMECGISG